MEHGTFVGWIGDDVLHSLYRIADVCVVPSIYEPFGLVALEAMASSCPCIVADTGGLREVVPHDEVGLRFRARDPFSLAEMTVRVLDDAKLRRRLTAEARHLRRFDWRDVRSYRRHLCGLIATPLPRAALTRAARRPPGGLPPGRPGRRAPDFGPGSTSACRLVRTASGGRRDRAGSPGGTSGGSSSGSPERSLGPPSSSSRGRGSALSASFALLHLGLLLCFFWRRRPGAVLLLGLFALRRRVLSAGALTVAEESTGFGLL